MPLQLLDGPIFAHKLAILICFKIIILCTLVQVVTWQALELMMHDALVWCFYRCWEQLLGFREIGYSWYVTLFSLIAPLLIVDHSSQQILIIKCDSEADVRRHHQWIFLETVTVVTSVGSRAVHGYVFCCFSEFRGLVSPLLLSCVSCSCPLLSSG